ncbi:unnamed protein product [Linum trigynum]|uniref:Reverse transcriptase zinc-binding domain-containing protein n=1 Tax=Linum trigynum TaxID=586398 RepID=A0AAV2F7Z8_9ROSI
MDRSSWIRLWDANIPPKLRVFVWQILNRILPTTEAQLLEWSLSSLVVRSVGVARRPWSICFWIVRWRVSSVASRG